jgi:hypothetical protein
MRKLGDTRRTSRRRRRRRLDLILESEVC